MVDFQLNNFDASQQFERVHNALYHIRQDLIQIKLRETTKNCNCSLFGTVVQLLILAGVVLLTFLSLQKVIGEQPKVDPSDFREIVDPYSSSESQEY